MDGPNEKRYDVIGVARGRVYGLPWKTVYDAFRNLAPEEGFEYLSGQIKKNSSEHTFRISGQDVYPCDCLEMFDAVKDQDIRMYPFEAGIGAHKRLKDGINYILGFFRKNK